MLNFASMKQHYSKYLVLFSLSLALGACSKNSTPTPTIDFGANDGYTIRDSRGMLTYAADPTDWTLDATWNDSETALFAKYNLSLTQPPALANGWTIIAYPNPIPVDGRNTVLAEFNQLGVTIPTGAGAGELRMAYTIVDANYTVQAEGDVSNSNKGFNVVFQYDAAKFRANTLYRIYYVMYNDTNKTVYYKGHGDVKVTR
jgi:hypothetical protein